jgi:hypothetical protein
MSQGNEQPRIEVLNPCDDGDDQKTPTTILFSNEGEFLAFGKDALQMYAEMLDEEETGLLFHTVSNRLHLNQRQLVFFFSTKCIC